MCGALPTGQEIREAKIKGTRNKAVLREHTFAVPCRITVCSGCGAADVGAINSTQSTVEKG